MTWRWNQPADHDQYAAEHAAQRYRRIIATTLEQAARDEAVDFDALVAQVNQKASSERTARTSRDQAASPTRTR